MDTPHQHESHPRITKRLKRAGGHLNSVIRMLEEGRPCTDIAQQLHAVEKAITNAKRELIFDHIDHCLDSENSSSPHDTTSFKTIAKYL